MELSRDKIKEIINDDWLLMDDCEGNKNCDVVKELARIALASLEAEPVAWRVAFTLDGQSGSDFEKTFESQAKMNEVISLHERAGFSTIITPIHSAQPAPVSVPDAIHSQGEKSASDDYYALGWNACRAAMLQGAEHVTAAYKLPANTPCKDAPEHIWLQTAGVWPENGEFSELTWCSDNQHPDDTLYVRADVVPGNFTVTPGGWKLVPNDPTTKQWAAGMQAFESGMDKVTRVYKAMIAAAPQREVNNDQ